MVRLSSREASQPPEVVSDEYPGITKGSLAKRFIEEILDGAPPAVTPIEMFHSMDVSLSLQEAADLGTFVAVETHL